jgi:hypothetical protein
VPNSGDGTRFGGSRTKRTGLLGRSEPNRLRGRHCELGSLSLYRPTQVSSTCAPNFGGSELVCLASNDSSKLIGGLEGRLGAWSTSAVMARVCPAHRRAASILRRARPRCHPRHSLCRRARARPRFAGPRRELSRRNPGVRPGRQAGVPQVTRAAREHRIELALGENGCPSALPNSIDRARVDRRRDGHGERRTPTLKRADRSRRPRFNRARARRRGCRATKSVTGWCSRPLAS